MRNGSISGGAVAWIPWSIVKHGLTGNSLSLQVPRLRWRSSLAKCYSSQKMLWLTELFLPSLYKLGGHPSEVLLVSVLCRQLS